MQTGRSASGFGASLAKVRVSWGRDRLGGKRFGIGRKSIGSRIGAWGGWLGRRGTFGLAWGSVAGEDQGADGPLVHQVETGFVAMQQGEPTGIGQFAECAG